MINAFFFLNELKDPKYLENKNNLIVKMKHGTVLPQMFSDFAMNSLFPLLCEGTNSGFVLVWNRNIQT